MIKSGTLLARKATDPEARAALLQSEQHSVIFLGRTVLDEVACLYDECKRPFADDGSPTKEGLEVALRIAAEAAKELEEKPGAWSKPDVIDRIRLENGLLD